MLCFSVPSPLYVTQTPFPSFKLVSVHFSVFDFQTTEDTTLSSVQYGFDHLVSVLLVISRKPVRVAVLVVAFRLLLPALVPNSLKPVQLAFLVFFFPHPLSIWIKTNRFTSKWGVLIWNVSEPPSMLEFIEANHLWFCSRKQKGENEER